MEAKLECVDLVCKKVEEQTKRADMEPFRRFTSELATLVDHKLPISRSKMMAITKSALKAHRFYRNVVELVEQFIQKCDTEFRVYGLYVLDSIIRHAKHRFKPENKDIFANEFAKNLTYTFVHVYKCPENAKEKVARVLGIWQKQNVYDPINVVATLVDMADPTHPNHQMPPPKPPHPDEEEYFPDFDEDDTEEEEEEEKKRERHATHLDDPNNFQTSLDSSQKTQEQKVENILSNFDALGSILTNPTVLQQLQRLQEQMSLSAGGGTGTATAAASSQTPADSTVEDHETEKRREPKSWAEYNKLKGVKSDQKLGSVTQTKPVMVDDERPLSKPFHTIQINYQQQQQHQSMMAATTFSTSTDPQNKIPKTPPQPPTPFNCDDLLQQIELPPHSDDSSECRSSDDEDDPEDAARKAEEEKMVKEAKRRLTYPPIKANHLSVCSTTIWVGHLSKSVVEKEITAMFGVKGGVSTVDMIASRGCAYVVMTTREDSFSALETLQNCKIQGKPIILAWAPPKNMSKKWKDYWKVEQGAAYIPWSKLSRGTNVEEFGDGGCLDELTLPPFLQENSETSQPLHQHQPQPVSMGLGTGQMLTNPAAMFNSATTLSAPFVPNPTIMDGTVSRTAAAAANFGTQPQNTQITQPYNFSGGQVFSAQQQHQQQQQQAQLVNYPYYMMMQPTPPTSQLEIPPHLSTFYHQTHQIQQAIPQVQIQQQQHQQIQPQIQIQQVHPAATTTHQQILQLSQQVQQMNPQIQFQQSQIQPPTMSQILQTNPQPQIQMQQFQQANPPPQIQQQLELQQISQILQTQMQQIQQTNNPQIPQNTHHQPIQLTPENLVEQIKQVNSQFFIRPTTTTTIQPTLNDEQPLSTAVLPVSYGTNDQNFRESNHPPSQLQTQVVEEEDPFESSFSRQRPGRLDRQPDDNENDHIDEQNYFTRPSATNRFNSEEGEEDWRRNDGNEERWHRNRQSGDRWQGHERHNEERLWSRNNRQTGDRWHGNSRSNNEEDWQDDNDGPSHQNWHDDHHEDAEDDYWRHSRRQSGRRRRHRDRSPDEDRHHHGYRSNDDRRRIHGNRRSDRRWHDDDDGRTATDQNSQQGHPTTEQNRRHDDSKAAGKNLQKETITEENWMEERANENNYCQPESAATAETLQGQSSTIEEENIWQRESVKTAAKRNLLADHESHENHENLQMETADPNFEGDEEPAATATQQNWQKDTAADNDGYRQKESTADENSEGELFIDVDQNWQVKSTTEEEEEEEEEDQEEEDIVPNSKIVTAGTDENVQNGATGGATSENNWQDESVIQKNSQEDEEEEEATVEINWQRESATLNRGRGGNKQTDENFQVEPPTDIREHGSDQPDPDRLDNSRIKEVLEYERRPQKRSPPTEQEEQKADDVQRGTWLEEKEAQSVPIKKPSRWDDPNRPSRDHRNVIAKSETENNQPPPQPPTETKDTNKQGRPSLAERLQSIAALKVEPPKAGNNDRGWGRERFRDMPAAKYEEPFKKQTKTQSDDRRSRRQWDQEDQHFDDHHHQNQDSDMQNSNSEWQEGDGGGWNQANQKWSDWQAQDGWDPSEPDWSEGQGQQNWETPATAAPDPNMTEWQGQEETWNTSEPDSSNWHKQEEDSWEVSGHGGRRGNHRRRRGCERGDRGEERGNQNCDKNFNSNGRKRGNEVDQDFLHGPWAQSPFHQARNFPSSHDQEPFQHQQPIMEVHNPDDPSQARGQGRGRHRDGDPGHFEDAEGFNNDAHDPRSQMEFDESTYYEQQYQDWSQRSRGRDNRRGDRGSKRRGRHGGGQNDGWSNEGESGHDGGAGWGQEEENPFESWDNHSGRRGRERPNNFHGNQHHQPPSQETEEQETTYVLRDRLDPSVVMAKKFQLKKPSFASFDCGELFEGNQIQHKNEPKRTRMVRFDDRVHEHFDEQQQEQEQDQMPDEKLGEDLQDEDQTNENEPASYDENEEEENHEENDYAAIMEESTPTENDHCQVVEGSEYFEEKDETPISMESHTVIVEATMPQQWGEVEMASEPVVTVTGGSHNESHEEEFMMSQDQNQVGREEEGPSGISSKPPECEEAEEEEEVEAVTVGFSFEPFEEMVEELIDCGSEWIDNKTEEFVALAEEDDEDKWNEDQDIQNFDEVGGRSHGNRGRGEPPERQMRIRRERQSDNFHIDEYTSGAGNFEQF